MLRYRGLWALTGFGYWAIEERASGSFVGDLGFAEFKRDIAPSIAGIPEMGWALTPRFHGQGYATEAALAALSWGGDRFARVDRFGGVRAVCILAPDNAPSIRVAHKAGFQPAATARFRDASSEIWGWR
jgi:RimJ/RimL family protein N-acetyltransferase